MTIRAEITQHTDGTWSARVLDGDRIVVVIDPVGGLWEVCSILGELDPVPRVDAIRTEHGDVTSATRTVNRMTGHFYNPATRRIELVEMDLKTGERRVLTDYIKGGEE